MTRLTNFVRPVAFALLVSWAGAACGGSYYSGYYDNYPYYYTGYGAYSVVGRPRVIVNGWTTSAFRYRNYRGYRVRVHHSPTDVYQATKGDQTIEVSLTDVGNDSTRIEVKSRRGEDGWDKESAKQLINTIMSQDKNAKNKKKNANADH